MHSAFETVVVVVCAVGIVGGLIALLTSGKTWNEYGKDHLLLDSDRSQSPPQTDSVVARDIEIRQLLQARNARRRRRGQPEIDVERALGRLTTPQIDADLREDIRQLVIARNHRRARQGKPPLDVEAEIAREIAALCDN